MANYDSSLTGAQIETALTAINGISSNANNGKILCVENGVIAAKSAAEIQGGTIDAISITDNGTYTHAALGGYSPVVVNVPRTAVVEAGSFTQNGVFNPPSGVDGYNSVTVNVSGGRPYAFIYVKFDATATSCTATNGSTVLEADVTNHEYVFYITSSGTWTVTISKTGKTKSENVNISASGSCGVLSLYFNVPVGYTELEYIESTGSQYINANLTVEVDFSAELIFARTSSSESNVLGISNRNYTYRSQVLVKNNKISLYSNTSSSTVSTSSFEDDIELNTMQSVVYTQSASYQRLAWGGSTLSRSYSTSVRNTCLLMGYKSASTFYSYIRLKFAKLYNNGTAVREFYPCRRNADGVLGLYDAINGTFYENEGTGAFVAGPDVT